jgi:hypothetical protein
MHVHRLSITAWMNAAPTCGTMLLPAPRSRPTRPGILEAKGRMPGLAGLSFPSVQGSQMTSDQKFDALSGRGIPSCAPLPLCSDARRSLVRSLAASASPRVALASLTAHSLPRSRGCTLRLCDPGSLELPFQSASRSPEGSIRAASRRALSSPVLPVPRREPSAWAMSPSSPLPWDGFDLRCVAHLMSSGLGCALCGE